MERIIIDENSRAVQITKLGFGKTFSAGVVPAEITGIVRFKALEDTQFRLVSNPSSVVVMSAGDTEYFFVEEELEIISGQLNLMW